jgi:predicted phosphoribosyltransferase
VSVAGFRDRRDAGRVLAPNLERFAGRADVVVLALPRGGVPVGFEVARALDAPLDVFVVRKLGLPGHEELAMGAIASGGLVVRNETVTERLHVPEALVERAIERERAEIERRELVYRDGRPPLDVSGKTAIVVDDGLATGATMRAAVRALRRRAARTVVAVPVAPPSTVQELEADADEIVCARTPARFFAVGEAYDDFRQTTDAEVQELLRAAWSPDG